MRFLKALCTSITFLLTINAPAQMRSEVINVLNLISKSQSSVKGTSADRCLPESKDACTLESFCGKVSHNANNFVLATDSEGYQIINSSLKQVIEMAEMCDQQPRMAAKLNDPFTYP